MVLAARITEESINYSFKAKFRAYGFNVVNNTLANYAKYLKRMNMVRKVFINDNTVSKKGR